MKHSHTFRLSQQAEQDIDAIVKQYPYLHDATGAIEFAVWAVAHEKVSIPAARPARRAVEKEKR